MISNANDFSVQFTKAIGRAQQIHGAGDRLTEDGQIVPMTLETITMAMKLTAVEANVLGPLWSEPVTKIGVNEEDGRIIIFTRFPWLLVSGIAVGSFLAAVAGYLLGSEAL